MIIEEKGRIIAALPYVIHRKWGFTISDLPPLVKALGPWLAPEKNKISAQHKYYEKLIQGLPKLAGFSQAFHPGVTNWLPFYWHGFQQTTRYTYILDLADLDRVYQGFNRNVRRNLKKAEVRLKVRHDLGLEVLYRLMKQSFERQGKTLPISLDLLIRHDHALSSHEARQFFFAVDEQNRVHSAAYLVWDSKRAYYHLSGDDPALRVSGSSILLTWEAIRYAKEVLQLPVFDFEGSMLPSVEPIRRQFGARQEPYFVVWKNFNPLFGFLDRLRKWRG